MSPRGKKAFQRFDSSFRNRAGDPIHPGGGSRARLKLMERDAHDRQGEAMLCECGAPLDAWELLREAEPAKTVLLCRGEACALGVTETARIFRAEVVQ